ncbi:hypothetical protein F4823DRAFT_637579 [Ustulina deusta]|nr:hypothetical protein F4823DRAFT_637579 [Ustulina deusta]
MTQDHGLDKEALDHWRAIDEMAYASIDPVEYGSKISGSLQHLGSRGPSISQSDARDGAIPRIATATLDDALNMDSTNTVAPTHLLEAARVISIAELCPDLPDPCSKAVGGVVTITWPYNKVKGTFAFNLAEPDFRLRRNKGQVRIDFTGRAAKAVGDSGLGGNDAVLLSLEGAAWEAEAVDRRRSLPGADIGWRLVFSDSLSLQIKRAETNETDLVIVNVRPNEHETAPDLTPIQPLAMTKSPSPPAPLSPIRRISTAQEINTKKLNDSEFASPAFVRRARLSYGALFEDDFDSFLNDGAVEGKGRKRTRFGRDSSSWRYASRSASPESAAASPESVDEQVTSPTRAVNSPSKAQMADEGCQTMELDQPSTQPVSTAPETPTHVIVPKDAPVDDAPTNSPTDSVKDRRTQTLPLNDWLSEPARRNTPALNSNDVPLANPGAPPPHSDQQLNSSGYNFASDPWSMSMAPSAFEPQQKVPSPLLHEPFASSSFGNITSGNQTIPFGEPDSSGKTYLGDSDSQEPLDYGVTHSIEPNPSGIDYPPLDPDEDIHPPSIHDEALTNYPASYLDGGHMSQQIMAEQPPQYPEVSELGSSSWATVNHSSNAPAIPPPDRLRSRDGDTPEQALVIDESDTDSDSGPEPMAVEDAVNNDRAYAQGIYEDAEAEDEVDAQYSGDDEPEYDSDEMGGDYDTRNYEQPGDDDEGSPDEGFRSQPLEPEFDDGESWDEEEQEEFLDEENEDEYETDEDMAKPSPQSAIRANPTVIDLISSSEDESEDENEDEGGDTMTRMEQSGARLDSRISPNHKQMILLDDPQRVRLGDQESEIISQASMSEAENSSEPVEERDEEMNSHGEEEGEYEDDDDDDENEEETQQAVEDEMELESCKGGETRELGSSRNQAKQPTEPEIKSGPETGPEGDAILDGMHNRADIPYHQTAPIAELHESICIEISSDIPEEGSVVPLSAADGLEMLSRAVDKESNARSHRVPTGSTVKTISEGQSAAEPPGEDDIQLQDSTNYQQNTIFEGMLEKLTTQIGEEKQVDPTASSNPSTSHPPVIISQKELPAAEPSSPPLTQSFRSLIDDNNSTLEEATVSSTAQLATTQLPTPQNTQITDTTWNTSAATWMNIAESFESYTTIDQPSYQPGEDSVSGKPADDLAQKDSNMNMGEDSIVQGRGTSLIVELQAQQPSSESPTTSSPARSFQTQVDDTEFALPDSVEETKENNQLHQRLSSESSSSASDLRQPFASHMEIDEELQASILEDSQLEGYLYDDGRDENDESFQMDTSEACIELEETGQPEAVSPSHEYTPAKQLAEDISAQLKRNFIAKGGSSGEESDTSIRNDPSVHLARAANASKRAKRKRAASTDSYRPRKRLFDTRRTPTPETDDSSIRLARASLASQTPKSEEDSYSMTAAKLQLARHLRDELPDCTSLKVLRQHLTKSLDVIAVAVMQPPDPQRAKGGPREYMMSFTIADHSIGPYAVAEALIYRPHKDTLPVVRYGDIVLLRNFTVVSLANKGFGLRTNNGSSWAVFDYESEPPQIRGPPVEYGERETLYVSYLREWFGLLDVKAREKLELANQKIINTGKSK